MSNELAQLLLNAAEQLEGYEDRSGVGMYDNTYAPELKAAAASLQSQVKNDTRLFCDLKTDEQKSAFFLTGRGYETGVIAHSIQNDVAMAYHRCSEYQKELGALKAECEKLMKAAASLQAQEPVVYWVLYDSTSEKKYIKKSLGDGSLAFFDAEAEAKRAQRLHGPGVGYKKVEYYRRPPTSAVHRSYLLEAARLRSVLVAAIRRVTGRPDIVEDGASLVDAAIEEARAMMADVGPVSAVPQQGGCDDEETRNE